MPNEADKELEQLLDDIFIAHEDNDSFTCNANYTTCTECNQRYYYLNGHPCDHNAKRLIGECNCSLKEEKAEAKAQLLAWRDRAVRAGRLEEVNNFQALDQVGTLERLNREVLYIDRRLEALTAEPKEEQ